MGSAFQDTVGRTLTPTAPMLWLLGYGKPIPLPTFCRYSTLFREFHFLHL